MHNVIYVLSDVQTYKTIHKTVQKSMIKYITIISKATSPACIDLFTASFQFTDYWYIHLNYIHRYVRVVSKGEIVNTLRA